MTVRALRKLTGYDIETLRKLLESPPLNLRLPHGALTLLTPLQVARFFAEYLEVVARGGGVAADQLEYHAAPKRRITCAGGTASPRRKPWVEGLPFPPTPLPPARERGAEASTMLSLPERSRRKGGVRAFQPWARALG